MAIVSERFQLKLEYTYLSVEKPPVPTLEDKIVPAVSSIK